MASVAMLISVLAMLQPNPAGASSAPLLEPLGGATLACQIALAGSLLWRRRSPLAIVWIITLAAAAIALVEAVSPGTLVPPDLARTKIPWIPPAAPFAVYSAMVHGRNRWIAWAATLVLIALGAHFWAAPANTPWPLQSLLFIGGPALLGMYVAARQRLLRALVDRAERAEREQYLLAESVLAQERSRVAAEMHDVVTHRVNLMVLQAGALRVSSQDQSVQAVAEELRKTGCLALEELRDLVTLLHGGTVGVIEARASTQPGVDAAPAGAWDLTALVNESRSVGVTVEFIEQGNPAMVAPIVARTAHRAVQEALTNARKHAPGASVQVSARYGPTGVRLAVRNTAPTQLPDPALTTAGSGTGLIGLRQRIELVNGSLDAGPARDPAHTGGFQVEVSLPADVSAARDRQPI